MTGAAGVQEEVFVSIEQVSPELESIVSVDIEVEVLGTGYVGGEGPLWWKEGQYLLFSEVRGNRRRKWSAGEGVTLCRPRLYGLQPRPLPKRGLGCCLA